MKFAPSRHFTAVLVAGSLALTAMMTSAAAEQNLRLPMYAPENYFRESCVQLNKGQELAYEVSTPYAIDFNLHHHPDTGPTVFPDRRQVKSQHASRITAHSDGEYCFTATNPETRPRAFEVVINYEIIKGSAAAPSSR